MTLSTCNQKDFLIESKLDGFWGVLLLLFLLRIYMCVTMYYL